MGSIIPHGTDEFFIEFISVIVGRANPVLLCKLRFPEAEKDGSPINLPTHLDIQGMYLKGEVKVNHGWGKEVKLNPKAAEIFEQYSTAPAASKA